jgi:signal transduction histidine kinase
MTIGPSPHPTRDPVDVAALLRLLAEATDQRLFFAALGRALPQLLPTTRVDMLAPGGTSLQLAGEADLAPPPAAVRSATSFAEWLGSQGYGAASTLPLAGAGQHFGWLVLARRRAALDAGALALAGQLAALIALRLLYDQARDDLAAHDEHTTHLERRLREHEDMRMRATLAVGTAHDIGNLFALVQGHAQLIQQSAPPALQRDLRAIVQAAGDGQFLLRRMLATQITSPVAPGATAVMIAPTIHEALHLTRPFWDSRPEIAIRTALGRTPPVRAHPAELREVLVNLLINAIGAMPSGGVLTLRSFAADTRAVVEVSDTGHGIAREHQSTIFQPFTTTREQGGGLGLSVSRAIVERYGGTLTVHSAPGEGATFAVALPAAPAHDAAREAQLRTRAVSG